MKTKKQWSVLKHWLKHNQQSEKVTFVKSFLQDPKAVGAIYPSSKYLTKIMASYVVFSQNQLVVELGAGTGVITQAMLNRGIPPEHIIAIESTPALIENLRKHFPKVQVIEGDASHLAEFLKNETRPIGTIISGLPLRSLPKEMTERILAAIPRVLAAHGRYIQFTYDLRKNTHFYTQQYRLLKRRLVWANIPPAKVEVYVISPDFK